MSQEVIEPVVETTEEVKVEEVLEPVVEEVVEEKVDDSSKQLEELKTLVEKQSKNFSDAQAMLLQEQEKVKNLEELVKTNSDLKKQYDESEANRIKIESENEKSKLLEMLKAKDNEILEIKKQSETITKKMEFEGYKRTLEVKYADNSLVLDGIKNATNKKEIDFVVKTYDKQAVADLSKMQAVAGTNAMADVQVVKSEGSTDWDAYFDNINAQRGRN